MKFRRNLLSRLYRNSDPDADSGGGGFVETPDPGAAAAADPATGTQGAAEAAAPTAGPGSMLEAMFGQKPAAPTPEEAAEAAAAGKTVQQLRDEKGRFAGKAPTDPNAAVVDPAKKPEAKPVDPNAMPEGLSPKAQERFQTLANTNKDLTAKVAEYEPIVQSALGLQQTFQQNGVKREQFDQAMQVVGLMNRGDLRGALAALDEQRKLISLHLGESLPGADPLADFPDLRDAVDNLQMSDKYAMEVARARHAHNQQQQANQRGQQDQQREQQQREAEERGQQEQRDAVQAVDKFCKEMQSKDLDYARIEPILLKEIQGGLLEGVPYTHRAALVQKTYALIKQTAASTRSAGPSTAVLRPTGGESPRQTPQTMHEAMWGNKP